MDKNKYNRAAKDSSQLQQFVDEVCKTLKNPVNKIEVEKNHDSTEYFDIANVGDVILNGTLSYYVTAKEDEAIALFNVDETGVAAIDVFRKRNNEWTFSEQESYAFSKSSLNNKARVWEMDSIDEADNYNEQMKNGDIIICGAYFFTGIINYINFQNGRLLDTQIVGFYYEVSSETCFDVYNYQNGEWSDNMQTVHVNMLKGETADSGKFLQVQDDGTVAPATVSGGTKLYKHSIDGLPGPSIAVLITTSSTSLTGQTLFDLLKDWQESLIVGYVKVEGKPWGMIRGTNLSGTSGSIYVDNYSTTSPTNLAYVAGSVITDTVTEL